MINLGTVEMPLNAATKTFAILAKRGAGKTYTAGVLAEEMYKNNIPFVVFDPIDVWWGLRFSENGENKGLPVVVFGLEHADIPLTRDMGKQIAQAVVSENVSCIISTFGMPKVAQRQLIAEFSEELLNINNTPRHIFIEEAHEFVPQRVFGAMGKVFAAVEALVVMGRNRGIGVTLINQRAATINKDVLTQIDTLLAFRNIAPQDRKALSEWVEAHGAAGDFEEFMKSLPTLPTGEGWIWSPEFLNAFDRIKIRKRETLHPDREKMGEFKITPLDSIDIEHFIKKFDVANNESSETLPEKDRNSVVSNDEQIREIRNDYESKLIQKDLEISKLQSVINTVRRTVGDSAVDIPNAPEMTNGESNLMLQKLGGMARNIYQRLLQHPGGLTKRQLALMLGYSVTSGSYSNALSKLRTMGLIAREGENFRALLK